MRITNKSLLKEGNLPQFYLSKDFSEAGKVTKDPESKKESVVKIIQESKKEKEQSEDNNANVSYLRVYLYLRIRMIQMSN